LESIAHTKGVNHFILLAHSRAAFLGLIKDKLAFLYSIGPSITPQVLGKPGDWKQAADSPVSDVQQAEWATYR
jgi:hypothetical protein